VARARDLTPGPASRCARAVGFAISLALSVASSSASAQGGQRREPRVQPEARADFIDARAAAAHLGLGVSIPVGTYVRMGIVGAAGQAWRDGEPEAAGRVDGLVRFVPDPLREFRWAPYAAGGVGGMYDDAERWRAVLVGVLGVEGPILGPVVPAIEVGFGGGTRVGVAFRRAIRGRR
jgi:hypothetical protein